MTGLRAQRAQPSGDEILDAAAEVFASRGFTGAILAVAGLPTISTTTDRSTERSTR